MITGYDSGSYGSLTSGEFPGDLFGDAAARTVAEVYEDADGYWYFIYSGGTGSDWSTDYDDLTTILVQVKYEDGRDTREFVLGGFIESRSSNTLKLDPPLPSRDWESRDTETVTIQFLRHVGQAAPLALPAALTEPPAVAGSWAELLNSAPGGPVDLQLMLTCMVWLALLVKSHRGGWPLMVGLAAMVLTPWIPVAFQYGEYILSTIITLGVAAVYFIQKLMTRQPQ